MIRTFGVDIAILLSSRQPMQQPNLYAMPDAVTTTPRRRRRSRLVRVLAAILVLVLALLLSYALWTVYENTLTTAALDEGPPVTATTSGASALSTTVARALKAYGGEAVWKDAVTVESTVTVGGLLFQLKGVNIPAHAKITVDVQRPHTVIDPVDEAGDVGVLDGFSVMIKAPDGKVLEERANAREHLQNASVTDKWDRLNRLYFLGYAFWRYYTLPFQLTRTDIEWTVLTDGLPQADFGTNLPVHSRVQRFWFD